MGVSISKDEKEIINNADMIVQLDAKELEANIFLEKKLRSNPELSFDETIQVSLSFLFLFCYYYFF